MYDGFTRDGVGCNRTALRLPLSKLRTVPHSDQIVLSFGLTFYNLYNIMRMLRKI